MLAEANVTVVRGLGGLVGVTKQAGAPTRVASVTAQDGRVLSARY